MLWLTNLLAISNNALVNMKKIGHGGFGEFFTINNTTLFINEKISRTKAPSRACQILLGTKRIFCLISKYAFHIWKNICLNKFCPTVGSLNFCTSLDTANACQWRGGKVLQKAISLDFFKNFKFRQNQQPNLKTIKSVL